MEKSLYDSKAWERLGDSFTNNYEQGMLDFRKNIIDTIIKIKPATLLEIACADGWFIEKLRASGYPNAYLGVDITPNLIERAKRRMPYERFGIGDAMDLNNSCLDIVNGESFSFVLCAGILMHLDNWPKAILEACRISSEYVMFSTYGTYNDRGTYRTDDFKNSFINRFFSVTHLMRFVPIKFNLIEFKSFPRKTEYMFQYLYERM